MVRSLSARQWSGKRKIVTDSAGSFHPNELHGTVLGTEMKCTGDLKSMMAICEDACLRHWRVHLIRASPHTCQDQTASHDLRIMTGAMDILRPFPTWLKHTLIQLRLIERVNKHILKGEVSLEFIRTYAVKWS